MSNKFKSKGSLKFPKKKEEQARPTTSNGAGSKKSGFNAFNPQPLASIGFGNKKNKDTGLSLKLPEKNFQTKPKNNWTSSMNKKKAPRQEEDIFQEEDVGEVSDPLDDIMASYDEGNSLSFKKQPQQKTPNGKISR